MEGRAGANGRLRSQSTCRTQRRESVIQEAPRPRRRASRRNASKVRRSSDRRQEPCALARLHGSVRGAPGNRRPYRDGAASDVTSKSVQSEAASASSPTPISHQLTSDVIAGTRGARLLWQAASAQGGNNDTSQAGAVGRFSAGSLRPAQSVHEGCSPNNRAFPQPPTPVKPHSGLSPRRRGNRNQDREDRSEAGSIPAQAGEPVAGNSLDDVSGSIPAQAGEPRTAPSGPATTWVYPRAGGGTAASRRVRSPRWVYPRAGGGTSSDSYIASLSWGLSPRRRGNPVACCNEIGRLGSIPAQAGEPLRAGRSCGLTWVYPRAGGGTEMLNGLLGAIAGLSPRRRGNRNQTGELSITHGSIPAQAGEPFIVSRPIPRWRVYPRAGGGTAESHHAVRLVPGLSPRRRGNRAREPDNRQWQGSIPAQAGEPRRCSGRASPWRVYPRAGGGTELPFRIMVLGAGLSPRRRGNRGGQEGILAIVGSIPAQAGEPSRMSRRRFKTRVYPRAGGGTAWCIAVALAILGLSPRRRGNHGRGQGRGKSCRSIPAQAGEPARAGGTCRSLWVYPRAGGGTAGVSPSVVRAAGLSPRRRGNRRREPQCGASSGSIPAQAGEPICRMICATSSRVYPRAGGGTIPPHTSGHIQQGLSPRRRGNRRSCD